MSEIAELINAIASILWPILVFVALLIFRSELSRAIGRIRKGKIFGQEVELDEDLVRLQESVTEASEELSLIPTIDESKYELKTESSIQQIIRESSKSPRTSLILLASEIEKEARQTLASIGKLDSNRKLTLIQTVEELDGHYGLPKYVSSSLKQFWAARNKIIHGRESSDANALSAIDSGVTLLKSLQSLPRETNWVHHEGVPIYSDAECTTEIPGVKGIILKTESASGAKVSYRIYPSTKINFEKGSRVSWEWSFENSWGEAWYKNPENNEIKLAWSSSAEFIGRNLDEV